MRYRVLMSTAEDASADADRLIVCWGYALRLRAARFECQS